MKHLIFTILLLCAPLTYADTVTNACPNSYGTITVTLNDIYISAGQTAKMTGLFTIKLRDPAYPVPGTMVYDTVGCVDGGCHDYGNSQTIPILPGGITFDSHADLDNHIPMPAGKHAAAFRIYLPQFDCSATANATVWVN